MTRPLEPQVEHDIVIVGAGHNGLTAGCYLSARGLDVLVVEANHTIGGMTSSGPGIPGAPGHTVNYCASDLVFWQTSPVAQELELHRHGLRTVMADPAYVYMHPDGSSLAIWKDANRTIAEIEKFSRADAKAYAEYIGFLSGFFDVARPSMMFNLLRPRPGPAARLGWEALRRARHWPRYLQFALASGQQEIDERFEHPIVRDTLACMAGGVGPINTPGSGLSHMILGFLHRHGSVRPVGGMQQVPLAMANRFESLGGTVLTGARVAQIQVRRGRAVGVDLTDGREFRARHAVVATCDPRTLFERLLPENTLSPRLIRRSEHIPTNAYGAGFMKVDIALRGRVDMSRHEKWRGDGVDLRVPIGLIGSGAGMARGYARCAAGLVPSVDEILLLPAVLNAVDEAQTPDGEDLLYLYCPSVPLRPDGGWPANAGKATDVMVDCASQFYGTVADLEIGRWVESPEDMAARVNVTDGAVLHVDLGRPGPLRPALGLSDFRLPVDGLFLGGAGAHPTGGVTGLPGRLVAHEVTRTLKRGRSRAR